MLKIFLYIVSAQKCEFLKFTHVSQKVCGRNEILITILVLLVFTPWGKLLAAWESQAPWKKNSTESLDLKDLKDRHMKKVNQMSPQRDLEVFSTWIARREWYDPDRDQDSWRPRKKETGSTKAMNSHFKCTQQPRWGWRRGVAACLGAWT